MLVAESPKFIGAVTKPTGKPPVVARFLPSLTDIAFLMPMMLLFLRMNGARTLLGDGDTGWHVRTGEWILANHRVPAVDMFSFTRPGQPWFAWEWLWDMIFAVLHDRWGMAAVVLASTVVVCATAASLFRLVRHKCDNGLVAIAVTLLATGGCAIHWLARPHLFTLLFVTWTLHLTERAREGRPHLLYWLVPLTLVWTNLHGGFIVVFLILACYMAGTLVDAATEADPARRRSLFVSLKPWGLTAILCLAMTFINPYGWNLHRHVIDYLGDPYTMQHINEFQGMNFHSSLAVYFEPLMIAALLTAFDAIRRRRFGTAFLLGGWLHMALIAQRNEPIFAIVAAPFIGETVVRAIAAAPASNAAAWIGRSAAWFIRTAAGFEENDRIGRVYAVSAIPVLLIGALLLAPKPAGARFTSTYDPKFYPEKALPLLLAGDTRHIFTDDEWGDYLLYHLYPIKRVFVDGRSDFYGDEFGNRYLDLLNVQTGWTKTLEKYDIDTIVLSPRFALTGALKISHDWRIMYDDGVSVVFRRARPAKQVSLAAGSGGSDRDPAITIARGSDRRITELSNHNTGKTKT